HAAAASQRRDHIENCVSRKTPQFIARDTPPETTRAMMLALSASRRSMRARGTTTSVPAMLYENGRYTATLPGIERNARSSWVTKPRARTSAADVSETATGLLKRFL